MPRLTETNYFLGGDLEWNNPMIGIMTKMKDMTNLK